MLSRFFLNNSKKKMLAPHAVDMLLLYVCQDIKSADITPSYIFTLKSSSFLTKKMIWVKTSTDLKMRFVIYHGRH